MKSSKATIWFIFVTILIDMIGIGLIIPVLPSLVRRFLSDPAEISRAFGALAATYAVMQFLFSPLLGWLSDIFGRRPILLVSLAVAAGDYLVMALSPALWILFIGRMIAGATGANFTVAMAYIADISNEDTRAKNFGMMGAAFGIGFILGPAIGGLLSHFGPETPFLVAAALNGLNWLYGAFVMPESLAPDQRKTWSWDWRALNPLSSLIRVLSFPGIVPFLIAHFCFQLAGQTHPSIWTLYTETRYHWSAQEVGFSLAVVGLLSALSQGLLTQKLIRLWGGERNAVVVSMVGGFLTFLAYGLASQGWMIYAVLVLSVPIWAGGPALQSLIAGKAPSQGQGELQGALVSLTSLSAILNPLITTSVFAWATDKIAADHIWNGWQGAPYYFAAIICLIGYLAIRRSRTTDVF